MPPKAAKKTNEKFQDDAFKALVICVAAQGDQKAELVLPSSVANSKQKFFAINRSELLNWVKDNRSLDAVKEVLGQPSTSIDLSAIPDIDLAKLLKGRLLVFKQEKLDEKAGTVQDKSKLNGANNSANPGKDNGNKKKDSADDSSTTGETKPALSKKEKLRDRPPENEYELPLLPLQDEPANIGVDFYCMLVDLSSRAIVEELQKNDVTVNALFHIRTDPQYTALEKPVDDLIVMYLDVAKNMSPTVLFSAVSSSCFSLINIQRDHQEYLKNVKPIKLNISDSADNSSYLRAAEKYEYNQNVEAVLISSIHDAAREAAPKPPPTTAGKGAQSIQQSPASKVIGTPIISSQTMIKNDESKVRVQRRPIINEWDTFAEFIGANYGVLDQTTLNSLNNINQKFTSFQRQLLEQLVREKEIMGTSADLRKFSALSSFQGDLERFKFYAGLNQVQNVLRVPSLCGHIWKVSYTDSSHLGNRLEEFKANFPNYTSFYSDLVDGLIIVGSVGEGHETAKNVYGIPTRMAMSEYSQTKPEEVKMYAFELSSSTESHIHRVSDIFHLSDGSTLTKYTNYMKLKNNFYQIICKCGSFTQKFASGSIINCAGAKIYVTDGLLTVTLADKLLKIKQIDQFSCTIAQNGNIFDSNSALTFKVADLLVDKQSQDFAWFDFPIDHAVVGVNQSGSELFVDHLSGQRIFKCANGFIVSACVKDGEIQGDISIGHVRALSLHVQLSTSKFTVKTGSFAFSQYEYGYHCSIGDLRQFCTFSLHDGKIQCKSLCNDGSFEFDVSSPEVSFKFATELQIQGQSITCNIPKATESVLANGNTLSTLFGSTAKTAIANNTEVFVLTADGLGYELIDDRKLLNFFAIAIKSKLYKVVESMESDSSIFVSISLVHTNSQGLECIRFLKFYRQKPFEMDQIKTIEGIIEFVDQKIPKSHNLKKTERPGSPVKGTMRKLQMKTGRNDDLDNLTLKSVLSETYPSYFESPNGKDFLNAQKENNSDVNGEIKKSTDIKQDLDIKPEEPSTEQHSPETAQTDESGGEDKVDAEKGQQRLRPTLEFDYLGNPRKEKPHVPLAVRQDVQAQSQANAEYEQTSGDVRRKLKTTAFSKGMSTESHLAVIPKELVLKTNSPTEVSMTNHGVEAVRFRIVSPKWLNVKYTVGPIAPGMTKKLSVKSGTESGEGEIRIITQWEVITIPCSLSAQ